jgi:hypothetical protein
MQVDWNKLLMRYVDKKLMQLTIEDQETVLKLMKLGYLRISNGVVKKEKN